MTQNLNNLSVGSMPGCYRPWRIFTRDEWLGLSTQLRDDDGVKYNFETREEAEKAMKRLQKGKKFKADRSEPELPPEPIVEAEVDDPWVFIEIDNFPEDDEPPTSWTRDDEGRIKTRVGTKRHFQIIRWFKKRGFSIPAS